jgi:hypothetical protein
MIDASIALSGNNEDPFKDIFAKLQEHKLGQMKQQLYERELAKDQQATADQEALKGMLSSGAQGQDLVDQLMRSGRLDEANAYQKQMDESQSRKLDLQSKIGGLVKQSATSLLANPTEAHAVDQLNRLEKITGANMDEDRAQIYSFRNNPDMIRKWAAGHALTAEQLLPKTEKNDLGGVVQDRQIDPVNGQISVMGSQNKVQTPDSLAANALTREGHQIQMRGQNMTDARAREQITQGGGANKAPAGYKFLPDGSLEAIKGGPADQKLNTALTGKETVNSVSSTLRDYYDQLKAGSGITDPGQGALSNIAAQASASGLGQAVGRMAGTQNQSVRDSIAMTRPLLLQAIMKATGMSAKQMDSNTELKLYLSTATDPTLGYPANKRALDKLEELYGLGSSGVNKIPDGKSTQETRVKSMPDPATHKGYEAEASDGTVYVSDGTKWVRRK